MPVFKAVTGLPPFMGILISLSILWLVTDGLHHKHEQRRHLRVPYVLTKVDISGVLFFLGILLCVGSLEAASLLKDLATWLGGQVQSLATLATFIGLFSAVVDNVPLVAATMGMYPLEVFPPDHTLWHMIAYAAGTGGSILIIGSSSRGCSHGHGEDRFHDLHEESLHSCSRRLSHRAWPLTSTYNLF